MARRDWQRRIADPVVRELRDRFRGANVVEVRAMSSYELADLGWDERYPVPIIIFDNGLGLGLVASRDEEGNGPGELFVVEEK